MLLLKLGRVLCYLLDYRVYLLSLVEAVLVSQPALYLLSIRQVVLILEVAGDELGEFCVLFVADFLGLVCELSLLLLLDEVFPVGLLLVGDHAAVLLSYFLLALLLVFVG